MFALALGVLLYPTPGTADAAVEAHAARAVCGRDAETFMRVVSLFTCRATPLLAPTMHTLTSIVNVSSERGIQKISATASIDLVKWCYCCATPLFNTFRCLSMALRR